MEDDKYKLPEHWKDFVCTPDNILKVWAHFNEFPILFDDFDRGDINMFTAMFFDPKAIIFATGDYGIARITGLMIGRDCHIHLMFWDRRFKGRDGECRQAIKWAFWQFRLQRMTAVVPESVRNTIKFLEILGFKREGIIRNAWSYKGKLLNRHAFGILRSEALPEEV